MTPGVVIITSREAVTTWVVISRYEVDHGTEHLTLW